MRTASWIPGLRVIAGYRREWLPSDLLAGLSVAAVALPIGIAYARVAGFPPVVGIYSSIVPLLAYFLFGSSRQLIVNPDAAACAIVAATVAPLAAGNAARHWELSIALSAFTGVILIAGGIAGLGVIANFLSRPILTGYLNGIALSIIAGQLASLLGIPSPKGGFFRTLAGVARRLGDTNPTTLAVGGSVLVFILVMKRLAPRVPAPLLAVVLAIAATRALALEAHGVAVVGPVPGGFPTPLVPRIGAGELWPLVTGAAGIVLVTFTSMMTTARGFASRNGYAVDANQEMIALGAADIAAAFQRGFPVSAAASRTAVSDAAGGKTQVTGLVAAATMSLVLLFLTGPIAALPTAALAGILVTAVLGLFDFAALREYRRAAPAELRHSLVAMLGVMTVGVLHGVLIAVALAILRLLMLASKPSDALLGILEGKEGIYGGEGGRPVPGLLIYRFDASLVFFNADHFQERVLALVRESPTPVRWLLFDAESVPMLDISGATMLAALERDLAKSGTVLAIARAKGRFRETLERTGDLDRMGVGRFFPTVHAGIHAFFAEVPEAASTVQRQALPITR